MLCGPVAMFLKVTTIVSPSSALSVGPRSPADTDGFKVILKKPSHIEHRHNTTPKGKLKCHTASSLFSCVSAVDSPAVTEHTYTLHTVTDHRNKQHESVCNCLYQLTQNELMR